MYPKGAAAAAPFSFIKGIFYVTIDKTAGVFYYKIVVYIANIITGGNIMYKQHIYKLFWFILVLAAILALQACHRPEQPTLQSTEVPTASHIDPTQQAIDPTEQITDPTEQATDPAEQMTAPTQPSTRPTEPTEWSHDAELTRFLTDVNHNGEYLPSSEPLAPGSATPVELIPVADQSYVGSTVDIILAQRQQVIPLYYYYNAETDFERLAVVITAEKIPLMMILETDLNGISELCKKIAAEEVFSAKVCSATNIDFTEGYVYVRENYYSLPEEQSLDVLSGNVTAVSGTYVGIVGSAYINGTLRETYNCLAMVDLSKGDLCQWLRIFERFDLGDIALEN